MYSAVAACQKLTSGAPYASRQLLLQPRANQLHCGVPRNTEQDWFASWKQLSCSIVSMCGWFQHAIYIGVHAVDLDCQAGSAS